VVVQPVLVSSDDWMINPKNRFRLTWDVGVIMPLLVYLTCVMPFRLCFGNEAEQFSTIYWFEFMIDMVFIVDICFNFRTGVFVGADGGDPGDDMDLVEYHRGRVFKAYLKSWLILDVVSGVPFALIDLVTSGTGNAGALKSAKSLRLLRFLKLGRLLKMEKILSNLDRDTQDRIEDFINSGGTRSVMVMVKLMLVLAYACHILACGFVLVGRTCASDGLEENWLAMEALGPWYPEDTEKGTAVWKIYVAAFYFTITTLTSVGYGDVLARNNTERTFVIVVEFLGAIMFAMIIAQITSVVTSMDMNTKKTAEQLDAVSSFVEIRAFPESLGRRIRRHFRHFYSLKAAIDETKIFSELSTALRKEVSGYLVMQLMGPDSFLASMPATLWPRLLPMLRPMRFEADEMVCMQGEECTEMYVVLQGSLVGETKCRGEVEPRIRHIAMGGSVNVLCVLGIWTRCVETVQAEQIMAGSTTTETYAVSASDFANLFTAESDIAAFEQMQVDEAAQFKMQKDDYAPTEFGRPLYLWCFSTVQLTLIQARGLINKARDKEQALVRSKAGKKGGSELGNVGSVAEGSEAWIVADLVDTESGKPYKQNNWRHVTAKHTLKGHGKGSVTGQATPKEGVGGGGANSGLEPFWGEVVRWMDISVPFDSAAVRIRLFGTDRSTGKEVVVGLVVLGLTELERAGVASAATKTEPGASMVPGDRGVRPRVVGDIERWYDLKQEDELYTSVKLNDGTLKRRLSMSAGPTGQGSYDDGSADGGGDTPSSVGSAAAAALASSSVHVRVIARRPEHEVPVTKSPLHRQPAHKRHAEGGAARALSRGDSHDLDGSDGRDARNSHASLPGIAEKRPPGTLPHSSKDGGARKLGGARGPRPAGSTLP